jgi:uncharacterized Zn-finger protein
MCGGYGLRRWAYNAALVQHAEERAVVDRQPAGEHLIQPNARICYEVTRQDLPLHCPMPGMYLWNSHPKVYLPITETGEAKCPYCGAVYKLVDFEAA